MKKSVESIIIELGQLPVRELRKRYELLYCESCFSKHKPYIIKRLVWKMQAQAEGAEFSPELHRRAELLAQGAEARLTGEPGGGAGLQQTIPVAFSAPPVLPKEGFLRRGYKGRNIVVQVTDGGFVYDGRPYRSLSAIAKEVTGTHINGRAFFKVTI